MRKAYQAAATTLLPLCLFASSAAWGARTERAAYQAQMHEFDAQGVEIRAKLAKFLTLNRKIASGAFSSLEFGEVTAEECTPQGCQSAWVGYHFCLKSITTGACHQVTYVGEVKFQRAEDASPTWLRLELTDHARSTCEPNRKWKWEAVLSGNNGFAERRLLGNPKTAATPGAIGCGNGRCEATTTLAFDLDE